MQSAWLCTLQILIVEHSCVLLLCYPSVDLAAAFFMIMAVNSMLYGFAHVQLVASIKGTHNAALQLNEIAGFDPMHSYDAATLTSLQAVLCSFHLNYCWQLSQLTFYACIYMPALTSWSLVHGPRLEAGFSESLHAEPRLKAHKLSPGSELQGAFPHTLPG